MLFSITLPDWSSQEKSFADTVASSPYTLLYFYPKDNTSGCTVEAHDFSALLPDFLSHFVSIIGVSKDNHLSHCSFIEKEWLQIPLISDPEWILHKQFGAVWEKSMYGKKYIGTLRSSFLLDRKGSVLHQRSNVKPLWHAQEILSYISTHLDSF